MGSHLIQAADDIDANWLKDVACVGVTAGASTPEFLVEQVVQRLESLAEGGAERASLPEVDEGMHFKLPAELRD